MTVWLSWPPRLPRPPAPCHPCHLLPHTSSSTLCVQRPSPSCALRPSWVVLLLSTPTRLHILHSLRGFSQLPHLLHLCLKGTLSTIPLFQVATWRTNNNLYSPDCPESCWEVRLRSGQAILLQVDRRSHQYHPGFQNIQKVIFTNPRIPHDKESSCSPWSQRLADCGGCPQARALIQSCLVEEDHLAPPHRRRFSDRGDFFELQLFWFWWSTTDLLLSLSSYLNIAVTPLPWHTTCVYHSGYHPPNSWR